jgi:glucose/mannose transport system permease protein
MATSNDSRFEWNRIALYAVLLGMVAFYLSPLESGIMTAFKTQVAFQETSPFIPPITGFTMDAWFEAFDRLRGGLVNSLMFTIPATVLSATIGSLTAYGLTNTNWRGQAFILMLFIAGIFIPYQAVLVPLSQFWANIVNVSDLLGFVWALGIDNDYAGLIELSITHIAYGIPMCMVLFRSYYRNRSEEMVESARLDGASILGVYRRIILPLSTPMFAVVLIYQFTQIWNDLLFALILVSSSASPAAPVVLILAGLGQSMEGQDFPLRMAGAFIAALPTLAVYVFFGEEFAEGVAT